MKNVNLFWKVVLIVLTISVFGLFIIIGESWCKRRFKSYYTDRYYSENCDVRIEWNGPKWVYNKRTQKTTTPALEWVARPNKGDTTTVFSRKGKRGYLSLIDGSIFIPAQYDRAWLFSENLAAVQLNNKIGFINFNGDVVIPFQSFYSPDINGIVDFLFKGNYCTMIDINGKYGLIDKSGTWKLKAEYNYIMSPVKGYRVVVRDGKYGVIDSLLNFVFPVQYAWIEVASNGFKVIENSIQKLYSFDSKTIINPFVIDEISEIHYNSKQVTTDGSDILIRSDYTAFEMHNKYGIIDKNGKVIINALYDEIETVNKDLFCCRKGDYLIFVNTIGQIIANNN